MSASAIHAEAFPVPVFPEGVDVHWETENRMVWNVSSRTRAKNASWSTRSVGFESWASGGGFHVRSGR
jgi:hypothetical protein